MKILTDAQYELLAFIEACNRNAYHPTQRQVMLWWENREPEPAEYRTVAVPSVFDAPGGRLGHSTFSAFGGFDSAPLSKMAATMFGDRLWGPTGRSALAAALGPRTRREMVKPAETAVAHMVRLTWLEEVEEDSDQDVEGYITEALPGLKLTDLGRALLRDGEQESTDAEDVSVVVFQVKDPLAYPQLVGQLANVGEGLLVDPYLKLKDLDRIVVSTGLTRLLVTGARSNQPELASIQTYLGSPSLARSIEVRSSMELHDRLLIADEGPILTLGTSLNGVGRKLTVLSPIPLSHHGTLRDAYEAIWDNAELVGPEYDEDVDGEDSEDESTTDEVSDGAAS